MKYQKKIIPFILFFFILTFISISGIAKNKKSKKKKTVYTFTTDYEVKRTPVKDQYRTGTCWCFATISFLESELLRM